MEIIPLESIEENGIMGNLQKGITFRFETFSHFEYVRSCSHVSKKQSTNKPLICALNNFIPAWKCVWKGLVAKLNLKVEECIDSDEQQTFNEYPDFMDIDAIEGEFNPPSTSSTVNA